MFESIVDWRENKSLSSCLLYMLESGDMCDVTFIVGEDKTRIRAHKLVLASRSAVFHTMFNGSLPERGDVSVPDIKATTFYETLRFIYCEEISLGEHNINELFYASDKYMLTSLTKACKEKFMEIATSEHATKALEASYQKNLNGLQEVKQASLKYIEKHPKECFLSDHALALSKECVEVILQNDFLDCTETDVCKFFLNWVRKQCEGKSLEPNAKNMREMAGSFLYLVKFPLVDMSFFSEEIIPIGILLPEEVIDIYQSHFKKKIQSSKNFSTIQRRPVNKRPEYHIHREGEILDMSPYEGVHALSFQSNARIWLKMITVLMSRCKSSFYSMQFIIENENEEEVTSMPVQINERVGESRICLKEPLLVLAGKFYTVILTFFFIENPCHFKMRHLINCPTSSEESRTGLKLNFKSSPKSTTGTNENQGVFKSFCFI